MLYLGQNNPRQHYMANRLESSSAENCLGVLVNKLLNMNQQCTLVARMADSILGCISKSAASRLREIIES